MVTRLALVAALSLLSADLGATGQTPPAPNQGGARSTTYKLTGARLAIGQDITVAADEEILDGAAVIGGSIRVDGRVRDGIVVVGGDAHFGPTADVRGDLVLVGGTLIRDPGARLTGSVSYVSPGAWWRDAGVTAWWPRVSLGNTARWLAFAATTFRVSLLAVLMILVLLVARAPVARVGRAAAAEPVRAAVVGLAAEVLFLPLLLIFSVALGLTIVGLPFVFLLVPLALLLALVALILGYTALACRLGEWIEDRFGWRSHSAVLATAIGLFLIVAPTLLARGLGVAPEPLRWTAFGVLAAGIVIEFAVWTIGLGATLMTGFGRWNTTPPPLDARV